jgi:hypothetical protein
MSSDLKMLEMIPQWTAKFSEEIDKIPTLKLRIHELLQEQKC